CWRFARADLLIGLLVVFVLGYVNKYAGWFPKYQVSMAPLLACLAAPLVAHAWCARPKLALLSGVAALGLGAAITIGLVRDDCALQRTWAIQPTAGAGLLGVVLGAIVAGRAGRASAATASAAVVGLTLGWSLARHVDQARADYLPAFLFGQAGAAG